MFTGLGVYAQAPDLVGPTIGGIPPVGTGIPYLPSRWSDMRYSWGSRMSDGHRWQLSLNGVLRLFATVTPLGTNNITVHVAGRLCGENQLSGRYGASLRNATLRR